MTGQKWGSLAEAIALAPSEGALITAGRNDDVHGRIVHHFRPPRPLPPEYWNGELDPERSRMRPCDREEYDGRGGRHLSIGCWVTVEIDLQSVREHFELGQNPATPRNKGGRPGVVSIEIVIEAGAWLAANGIPKPKADFERAIRGMLEARGLSAAESTIKATADKLIAAHRQALGEAGN